MSTQFEFIMQLYMMNLLQQQQQQQQLLQQQSQQQQHQQQQQQQQRLGQQQLTQQHHHHQQHILNIPSPRKREMDMDISSSTMTPTTNTNQQQTQSQQHHHQQQQHMQQLTSSASPTTRSHNPRTLIRKNSHTTTNTPTTTTTTTINTNNITNCSSSSSCIARSPNSNSTSSIAIQQQQQQQQQSLPIQQPQSQQLPYHNTPPILSPLQQLLLGQMTSQPALPPMLTSSSATTKTPPNALTTPSNLLLTPTTPTNSGMSAATALSLAAAAYNVTACSQFPQQTQYFPPPTTTTTATNMTLNNNETPPITTGNFLQSSTVTSTPTEEEEDDDDDDDEDSNTTDDEVEALASQLEEEASSSVHEVSIASNGVEYLCDTISVEDEKFRAQAEDLTERRTADRGACIEVGVKKVEAGGNVEQQKGGNSVEYVIEDDEEDEKPLAALLQGATTAGNLSTRSSIGMQNSANPSEASSGVPYQTPTKQPADSTHYLSQHNSTNTSQDTGSSFTQLIENEGCNMTPMSLAKTLLTPPASDQVPTASSKKLSINVNPTMQTIKTESTQSTTHSTASAIMSLGCVSSLDAFLQNEENLKNLQKVSSYLECENALCRQENLREHFHCYDEPCQGKILSKKDDIIRHLKWHKKRKESLLLGFARFSASDDCEPSYGAGCAYCWKQTHYHCVYEDCPKVYVSTSDVQMHANFHRKNSEIVQEGFRRFRAHENCKIEDCPFFGKKTSHYHCCREGCNHTFKNKADMEKHKSYHLRDYQLTQDGFKKILKTEACPFDGCKFSTVCNHIHCVRESCNYILHSSSQMISHKRKHDRLDGEQAYQSYKKQKDSSGEDSPASIASIAPIATTAAAASSTTVTATTSNPLHTTTPLSSLSADRFLARKRGRPPKKIELPVANDTKRIKLEPNTEQASTTAAAAAAATAQLASNNGAQHSQFPSTAAGLFPPPFLGNYNAASAAAVAASAAQSMQMQDPNAPNVQLTHLMALFQLQNPLFYQNLYPGGMPTNMANMLGAAAAAAAAAGGLPPISSLYGHFPGYGGAAAGAPVKSEYGDKQQQPHHQQPYKE